MIRTLFDFSAGVPSWSAIDDRVMGGRSVSGMQLEDGAAVFAGNVSFERNGGFASVRSAVGAHDLAGFEGLSLRVRGDGGRYGIRLRTDGGFDGVNYQSEFETEPGVWLDRLLPFDSFVALYRGRRVGGGEPLDTGSIRTFGLITLGHRAGGFRLEIGTIAAYATSAV